MYDVVVVGAGPSGLAAATTLVSAGLDVVVLEARDRVGGRTWSTALGEATIDLGGQWVGPDQHALLGLIGELGLETSPTPTAGRSILVLEDRSISYRGTIPRLPLLQLLQLQRELWAFDRLARRVGSLAAETSAEADLDDQSLASWMAERRVRPEVASLVRTAMRIVFGHEAEAIPVLRLAQYVKAAGGVMPLVDTAGGAQDARIVGGMQQVCERLTDGLGDRVVLGAAVAGVATSGDEVRITTEDGRTWSAGRVVFAIPPNLVMAVAFDPALPAPRTQWLEAHVMGNTIKAHLQYGTPFWRDAGLSGEVVWADGPIDVIFDNTYPGGPASLVAFATGDRGRALGRMGVEQRQGVVTDAIVGALGSQAATPRAYIDKDWDTERWSGGCPVATPSLGAAPSDFDPTTPDGPIHWAGTETATVWRGYIDGAVVSGRRAADQVLGSRSAASLPGGAA